jgi:Tol biopolymer transport system component
VAWRGGELWAVEPGGRVRWSLARPRPISAARWGPVDGYRIAYLAGARLRVVNGDGTGDRPLVRAREGVAPAWRPDRAHVLAYAGAGGRVRVVAVDSGRELWRTGAVAGIRQLAWSPDGARLLVATDRRLILLGRSGRRLAQRRLASDHVAWAPRGGRVAVVRRRGARGEVVLADPAGRARPRVLFTGPGGFGPVAWSPSGRRVLVPWPEADQWLFLDAGRGERTTAVANIARQFGRFPRHVEWCCAG